MIVGALAVVLLAACGRGDRSSRGPRPPRADSVTAAERAARPDSADSAAPSMGGAAGPQTRTPTPQARLIVFLGTSLTAGLGLDPDEAYPALIERRLEQLRLPWRALNAGVSGETSAGALRRLDAALREPVAILVVETGANDGLRGLELDSTRANLEAIVRRARAARPGVRIVLAGMEVPPNLGPRYAAGFRALFPALAARDGLPLIPFLLQGVGGVDSLNQADGIHPNAAGARIVADNVWRVLGPLVERDGAAASPGGGAPE
jgi:acyl-CoA thioesterase-1